jgi:hypothetical protein
MTLFKDCCHSEKVIFSLLFSNSFSSNSNSFPRIQKSLSSNSPDAEGYKENRRPKTLPVDSASYIGGGQTNGTTKCIIGVQKIDACGQALTPFFGTSYRTMGFSQNRDIVALVHKNSSYIECNRYVAIYH